MKVMKQVAIIEGNLASFIHDYVRKINNAGQGFEDFSDEAILYSYLEYAKFPRNFTKEQRIIYLFEKCCAYSNIAHGKVSVEYDVQYDCFHILLEEKRVIAGD
jgi:hypothetical protein